MEEMASKIKNVILVSALETAGRQREKKDEKLKSKTKDLLKRRREMIQRGTPRTNIEYAETCKTIRKLLRKDVREYNTTRVKEAVETGKRFKKATNKERCKVMIPSLKEEDRSITTNRQRILEICAEFYRKLYEDVVQNIAKTKAEEVSPILASERRKSLEPNEQQQSARRRSDGSRNDKSRRKDSPEEDPGAIQCSLRNRNSA